MVVGIGTDIIDVARIEQSYNEYGDRFIVRIFTQTEIDYCNHFGPSKFLHFAARFAAKEAFSKAIGTGMRQGMAFRLVGIRNEPSGLPRIELFGKMLEQWGSHTIHVTLSHTSQIGLAVVVISS